MRLSIKGPIPEILATCDTLSRAVDAHLAGDFVTAERLFGEADTREVWNWTNPSWGRPDLNVVEKRPDGDTQEVPKETRDHDRRISKTVRSAVLKRDGYRCRYCGIPVVDAKIRKIARKLYPKAVPWVDHDSACEHAGFQCLWLQYDHVVPHSHGGRSTEDNVVICCALCNFGKDKYTLRQLGLSDPRLRPPEPTNWDGLGRLRSVAFPEDVRPEPIARSRKTAVHRTEKMETRPANAQAFFLAGAWVSAGYLFTPPINGKERWFKLDAQLSVTPIVHAGVSGYLLVCDPVRLRRRKITLEPLFEVCGHFMDSKPWGAHQRTEIAGAVH